MRARPWENKETDRGMSCVHVRRTFQRLEMICGHRWLNGGGHVSTEFYPGRFRDIGLKYKMSGLTVSHIWKTFCPAFDVPQRPIFIIRTNDVKCFLLQFICNITVLEIVLITK